ncbi:reticulon-like protein B21 isoform X2 [Mercurialis annua]|uniref:reticulon-like protein B21 isoform X2 n=1 Tax=Mercurialis annua TaxID=3986 RepID=UPI002160DF67|nr:reticulon-like protein B21 isoform X2 [Mercurialis annua]
MDVGRRRGGVKTSVIAGSVWESRMKHDEVKGGIKVFNGETNNNEEDNNNNNGGDCSSPSSRKLVKRSPVGPSGKRKTWKSDGPIQIAKGKTDSSSLAVKNCEEQCRELSVSVDGGVSKKSLNFSARRGRSDGSTGLSVSVDGIDKRLILGKSPVQMRNGRSDVKEIVDTQLRKVKSDSVSSEKKEIKERSDDCGGSGIIEKNSPEIEENGSEESCKEFSVCQEKVISSTETYKDDDDDEFEGDDEEEEGDDKIGEEMEIEVEIEKKSVDDIMEILNVQEEKPRMKVETKPSPPSPSPPPLPPPQEQKPKKVVVNEDIRNKVHQFRNRAAPPSPSITVNKQPPPVLRRAAIYQNLSKPTPTPVRNNEYQNYPERHNKLQNIVDLVMWRDISRSAFVFGIGTFTIISSSYTKDLNVSFISVMSYVGLVYLALIFLYRSLIHRGVIDIEDRRYVVGEEEAVWLIKLVLPYLNECLWKIRALFSGDPATTMKYCCLFLQGVAPPLPFGRWLNWVFLGYLLYQKSAHRTQRS